MCDCFRFSILAESNFCKSSDAISKLVILIVSGFWIMVSGESYIINYEY